jgi:hypothetical protein
LPKDQWKDYFDRVSKQMQASSVETSVDGLDLGHQYLTSNALLEGVSYERASETLTFFFQGLTHNISAPREILVDDGPEGLRSIVVLDSEGRKQIAMFHGLLELPAA